MADSDPSSRPAFLWLPRRILSELGLITLFHSPRDVKVLCLQRFVRLFAYGSSTLILVPFLESLGHSRMQSGLFMTLTLVGDVLISFLLALIADSIGRRSILALGATLMALSGLVFACASNYWVLLAAAVLGVISPNGNEIGPFRAVEESGVAHLTTKEQRGDVYAWYSLLGNAGTAFGMMTWGWAIHGIRNGLGWTPVQAYRATFVGYAILGVVKLLLAMSLSRAVEPAKKAASAEATTEETTPLLAGEPNPASQTQPKPKKWTNLLPEISPESRVITATLCLLFALDSFASGLVPLSWVSFYFRSRFGVEEGKLGSIFFITSIISAATVLVASSLAKRFGNINTMVFTHLPSSILLSLIPLPSSLSLSLLFLILRACTQSMDVAPRSAFLAAVLLPNERTAVMGAVNVVKITAQSMGPFITGVLASHSMFWMSFVIAGSLKACYDMGLLVIFKHHEQQDREARPDDEA
ncbi:hypothetical protein HIM_08808 [Hirsutella minnesotensis 3608]|uniref:Major facilitator superfamily (MFS) profile domain-containing protein n=1 Tax=Hirsutella minnesotensis 3608 TaxID=1043627 RepID=A0A0F7ZSQ8_9HYPO|nr:hypothetical protein HIM_08808 [Hirsutella minnesotensis 3608]